MKSVTKSENGKLALSEQDKFIACEKVIKAGHETFIEVGNALAEIRDSKLYREKFQTFEDYCKARWGFSDRHARNLIASSSTAKRIASSEKVSGTVVPVSPNERQARALSPLSEDAQLEAWEEAVETAPSGKVTAKHVEQVVAKKLGKDEAPAPAPQESPETAPEPEAAAPEETTLEKINADIDRIIAGLKAIGGDMRDSFGFKKKIGTDEYQTNGLHKYSYMATVGAINQIISGMNDERPVEFANGKVLTKRGKHLQDAMEGKRR